MVKGEYTTINGLIDKIAEFETVEKVSVQIDFYDKRRWTQDITNPTLKSKDVK